jgi:hypothetical protein
MEEHDREPKKYTFVMCCSIKADQFLLQKRHKNNKLHYFNGDQVPKERS